MGTNMEGLQNAYRGFSRGNFTMLDNLSLGFAGTKEGMQQLLEKAEEISKKHGDAVHYSIDSYADMVQAIHVVQEEMGITGTTAKEAGDTIQGSAGSAKKAWDNLLAGFADPNANIDVLLDNLIASLGQMGKNIAPKFEQAFNGITKAITKIAPVIGRELPKIITKYLPSLVKSGKEMMLALLKGIKDNIKELTKGAGSILKTLVEALVEMIPMMSSVGWELVNGLVTFIADNAGMLVEQAVTLIQTLTDTFTANIDTFIEAGIRLIVELAVALADNADKLIDSAITLILTLTQALMDHLPELLDAAVKIVVALVKALVQNAPRLLEGAILFIATLVEGIRDHLGDMIVAAAEIIGALLGGIRDLWEQIGELGARVIMWFVEGLVSMYKLLTEYGDDLWDTIKGFFSDIIDDALTWGSDLIGNMIDGMTSRVKDIGKAAKMIGQEIADFLHFSEPEKGPLADFHTFAPDMIDLFASGMYDNLDKIKDASYTMASTISGGVESAKDTATGQTVAVAGAGIGGDIVIPVYIGQDRIDEVIVSSEQVRNYRSGGR